MSKKVENDKVVIQSFKHGKEIILKVVVSKEQKVDVSIYNIRGEKIRTMFRGFLKKGVHEFSWDMRDKKRREVKSGVYLVGIKKGDSLKIDFKSLIFIP